MSGRWSISATCRNEPAAGLLAEGVRFDRTVQFRQCF
jgi:hypothetical protein